MQWYNEPPSWNADGDTITVRAGAKTDFWRKTHSGEVHDNGHFYFREVTGDFVADVRFSAGYGALYDQAGLMVRLDDSNWLKCGIEFFEGVQHASVVVTRDFSDWSVVPLKEAPPTVWLRVVRERHTFAVTYSLDGTAYPLLRQAYLTPAPAVSVGVMCCAPIGDGFTAVFEGFTISGAT
jgi:regulation of enolase protein 1 (concanavalin A-like superfamily)